MNITDSIVASLNSFKLTLNDYLILHCIKNGIEWHRDMKLDSEENYRRLVRRGYLDSGYNLTEQSNKLLEGQLEVTEKPKKKSTELLGVGNFDEFWEAYPASDKYGHHAKTRVLRVDKLRTSIYYSRVIQEGQITHEQLMQCLYKDIEMRKMASYGKENKFSYMPQSTTWLNKRYFDAFIEEVKEYKPTKQDDNNTGYGNTIS